MNMLSNLVVKLTVSTILSSIIGYERERFDKPIGLRTIILTSNSATVFTIISLKLTKLATLYNVNFDISRIIAYMIAGIGFLGSGIIIKRKNDLEGTTTAICLWIALAIGILIGLNLYLYAIVLTLYTVFILQIKLFTKRKNK